MHSYKAGATPCRINRPSFCPLLSFLLQITMGVSACLKSVSALARAWPSKVSGDGEDDAAASQLASTRNARARGKGKEGRRGIAGI